MIYRTIVKAAAKLNNENIKISILGDGPDRIYLEKLNKKMGASVDFIGRLPYKKMISFLKDM